MCCPSFQHWKTSKLETFCISKVNLFRSLTFWRSCYARLLHSITTNALVAFTSTKAKRGWSNHLHPVSHRNWTIKERTASPTAREPSKQRIHSVNSHDGNPAARKPSSGHLCAAFISSVLADRRNYRWEPATRRMHCVNAISACQEIFK